MSSRRSGLKILMVAPNPFFVDRGFSVHVLEQARALRARGYEISFAAYHCGRDPDDFPITRSLRIPWYREDETGASIHRLYLDALLLVTTFLAVRRQRPDVIHGHLHEGAMVGICLRFFGGPPVLLDMQGSLVEELDEKGFFRGVRRWLRPLAERTERWITSRSDAIVTSSRELLETVVERYEVPRERARWAMDGVDVEVFSPRPADRRLAAEIGLPPDRRIVVFLGLLTRHQGIDFLIEAAQRTLRARDDHHYLIMGYPDEESVRSELARRGLEAGCTVTGKVPYDRAPDYLSLGDVAISPKVSETEGNGKLYNYMAMALPVVSFDRPADREVLGDTAIFCRRGDADDLAAGILRALDDPETARRLGRAGRRRVVDRFGWQAVAQTLEDTYRFLLAPEEDRDDG